jgi:hypothetical protein
MPDRASSRRRLLLVNPWRRYRIQWDLQELCRVMGRKTAVHPLALPTVAALTPSSWDVRIVDEHMEELRFEKRWDLVGISALAPNTPRAYQIADRFRELGVPVVMGGPQASFNVEETLRHADSVVVGEAEGVWEECLADVERGALKPTYRRAAPCDFKASPRPRWDLVDTRNVMALGVQASRGCPYSCEFCLVRNMFGQKQRYRDLDDLVAEIRSLPKGQLAFVDDNLTANKPYARELMRALKPLKVSWMCQSSLEICEDEALLRDMAEAGCTSVVLGIESLNPESLKETGKFQNRIERYEEGIRRVHARGIHVIGMFIVGFDHDRADAFEQIFDFTLKNNLSQVMLNILTAYPGTDLYERMKREGRLACIDPEMLNGIFPTIRHNHLSQAEIFQLYFETVERFFAPGTIRQKALGVFGNGAFQRFNEADISLSDKARSFLYLLREHLFTSDREKRRLFTDLFGLVARGKASGGSVVEFLLLISSFSGYLRDFREYRDGVLEEIRRRDPGALVDSRPRP